MFHIILKQTFYQGRGWLKTHPLAKVSVMVGFLTVLGLVMAGIYLMAKSFFLMMSLYGSFGQAVVTYSIQAGLVILLILGILSAMLSTYGGLYRAQSMRHWLSLPLPYGNIFWLRFGQLLLQSGWAMMVVLVPTIFALMAVNHDPGVAWRGLFVLSIMILTGQCLGGLLTVWLTRTSGQTTKESLTGWAVFLVVLMVLAGKLLFPPSFFRLGETPDLPTFNRQMGHLPLASQYLPTSWLSHILIQGWSFGALIWVGIVWILLWWLNRWAVPAFITGWYKSQAHLTIAGSRSPMRFHRHYPKAHGVIQTLIVNELLALTRSGSELIYCLFILGLGVAYYLIIRTIPTAHNLDYRWLNLIYISTIGGFGYLVIVLSGRFIYPLMAKEAKTLWLLLSAPIDRWRILDAKLTFGLILLIPWFCLGMMTSTVLNLGSLTWLMSLLLIFIAVVIAVIHLTLGTISPNFAEGERPDNTSTSASGMLSLLLSLMVIGGAIAVWQQYQKGQLNYGWLYFLAGSLLVAGLLTVTIKSMNRYERV